MAPMVGMDPRKPHPPSLSPRGLAIVGWSAFLIAGLLLAAWLHAYASPLASSTAWLVLCLSGVHRLVRRKMVISGDGRPSASSANAEQFGP